MNKNPNAATAKSNKAVREQAIKTHHAQFLSFFDRKSPLQRSLPTTAISFITRKAPIEGLRYVEKYCLKMRFRTGPSIRSSGCLISEATCRKTCFLPSSTSRVTTCPRFGL
ncbi:hypothetical protein V6N13_145139 [Hibiscus sabdariffa]